MQSMNINTAQEGIHQERQTCARNTHLPVSMSVWYNRSPFSGLSMFMRCSRFISMSLLGVKLLLPRGGVTLKLRLLACSVCSTQRLNPGPLV